MIFGIGIDLVHIKRMAKAIDRWGNRLLDRVFTPSEQELCLKRVNPVSAFAMRFAAKEAFSKALGTGMKKGVRWLDIEVYNTPEGRPMIRLKGKSKEICMKNNIREVHLSLSDEKDYGIAMVILEK
jgi:holo-[acyl-carrier protein] synthase